MLPAMSKSSTIRRKSTHAKNKKIKNKLNIALLLILLIIIVNKIRQFQTDPLLTRNQPRLTSNTSEPKYLRTNAVFMISCSNKKLKIKVKTNQPSKTIVTLLLILSNDIHPNPGPRPPHTELCLKCNSETQNYDSLQCETCNTKYHMTCLGIDDSEHNTSFEWICPALLCKPNHHNKVNTTLPISPNRYSLLEEINPVDPNDTQLEQQTQHSHKLLKELSKISPRDFQGKDLCRSCHKEVKWNQQALSCDKCDRWIHRVCSDVTVRVYNQCKRKTHFNWICNKCRTPEVAVDDRVDITTLNEDARPDPINVISCADKEMLILSLNCRSAINKVEEIADLITKLNPDIVCLTETWFDASVPPNAYIPYRYKIIRHDRSEDFKQKYGKTGGGGIAVLYKEHLKVVKKDYLTDPVEEILWVQVKSKQSFLLGTIYRSEYTTILDADGGESKIEENVRKATEISDRLIITGDLNIDTSDNSSKLTDNLQNIYQSYGLTQLVKKPTRRDKASGKLTTIDHIWTNMKTQLVKNVGTCIGVSDHLSIYAKLNLKKPEEPETTIRHRSYKRYNAEDFKVDLHDQLLSSSIEYHISNKDVNSATEELIKVMQTTAEVHAPMVQTKIKPNNNYVPWFTDELKDLITQKHCLVTDFFYYGSNCFKERIRRLSNSISHLKRKLKKKYITEKFKEAQGDTKKCWNILNQATNRTKSYDTVEPDMLNQEKVNNFNKYFATVGIEIQKKLQIVTPENNFAGLAGFSFKPETTDSIGKLIDKIRDNVATGEDDISAKLIKDSKEIISPILMKIINIAYETATFPTCMKNAVIKPIHKKSDPDEISNYRPISILPTLSKVFERAPTDQLVEYLENNNLLSKNQHAYRKRHSTKTCLVELINYIYKLLDLKRYIAIASLDLSKAFDSISHSLILQKLSKMGMSENTIRWIKSYLSNRRQKTKFSSFVSSQEPVLSGVPQGSIIGPLLFLCFTNDLPSIFEDKCKMICYADDTQLVVDAATLPQLIKKLEEIITLAQKWYTQNSMKNNIGKTEIMIMNNKNTNLRNTIIKIKDDGKPISLIPQTCIKVLGVLLDDKLNWIKQVNKVKRSSMNATRNLHRINHLLPIKEKVNLYNALIVPHFDYADIAWGGCGKINSNKLQIVQNFAAKSITGHKKSDSATFSRHKLKFLDLQQRRNIHEAAFVHKSLQQLNPTNINSEYAKQQPTSNTRNSHEGKLNLPIHRTSKYQQSPFFRTIKSWNSSPTTLTQSKLPNTFKINLQKHVMHQTFRN